MEQELVRRTSCDSYDVDDYHASSLTCRGEFLDVERGDAARETDAPPDQESTADHCPVCQRNEIESK